MLSIGDKVTYIGNKFRELLNKIGEVQGKVEGHESTYICDFGEDQGYIMQEGRHIRRKKVSGTESLSLPVRHKKSDD